MYLNKIELVLREKWSFYSQILCLYKNLIRQNRLIFNVKKGNLLSERNEKYIFNRDSQIQAINIVLSELKIKYLVRGKLSFKRRIAYMRRSMWMRYTILEVIYHIWTVVCCVYVSATYHFPCAKPR